MNVAIVIGHNSKGKGAYSESLGYSEFDFFKRVSSIIKKNAPSVDVYERKHTGSYSSEMKEVVSEINRVGYDLVIEMHFNAANGTANGVEVLHYSKSKKGIEWANSVIKIHELVCGLSSRGLKPVSDNSVNGSYGILNSKMPYILTESFFGDNESDTEAVSVEKIAICFLLFLHSVGVHIESKKNPPKTVEERLTENEKRLATIEKRLDKLEE